ncbi:hypothetical protein [Streptomyces europaeiscabiei]|uniref:hypothetical protein n=1 Tax=Streptomyces europaeiscabiei TaxID=146819 RepID=UPI002E13CDA4|nr:hypothetical protein OHB30_00855 [Streptomyces europaeiscabiei]
MPDQACRLGPAGTDTEGALGFGCLLALAKKPDGALQWGQFAVGADNAAAYCLYLVAPASRALGPDDLGMTASVDSMHGGGSREQVTIRRRMLKAGDGDCCPYDRPRAYMEADLHEDRLPYGTHLVAADLPGLNRADEARLFLQRTPRRRGPRARGAAHTPQRARAVVDHDGAAACWFTSAGRPIVRVVRRTGVSIGWFPPAAGMKAADDGEVLVLPLNQEGPVDGHAGHVPVQPGHIDAELGDRPRPDRARDVLQTGRSHPALVLDELLDVPGEAGFPNEAAALKCIYMALMSLDPTGHSLMIAGYFRPQVSWNSPNLSVAASSLGAV